MYIYLGSMYVHMCIYMYICCGPKHGVFTLKCLCRFYTYGDFPLAGHLEQIDSEILQHFTRSSSSLTVPLEPRWNEPVSVV